MGRVADRRTVHRIDLASSKGAGQIRRLDTLAAEEPLEIRAGPAGPGRRRPLTVTMRTPGDDLDLALGFLLTEGLIRTAEDVLTAQLCAGTDTPNTYNVVDVVMAPGAPVPETDPARNFYTTSSCGVCGSSSRTSAARRLSCRKRASMSWLAPPPSAKRSTRATRNG